MMLLFELPSMVKLFPNNGWQITIYSNLIPTMYGIKMAINIDGFFFMGRGNIPIIEH